MAEQIAPEELADLATHADRDLLAAAIDAYLDGSSLSTPARSAYGREFFIRKAIGPRGAQAPHPPVVSRCAASAW